MNQKHRVLIQNKSILSEPKVGSIPPLPVGKSSLVGVGGAGLKAQQQGGAIFSTMAANASNSNAVGHLKSLNSNDKILLKKIKDLETQNERLRKHVGQAEDAIRNYRGFMSGRRESAGGDISKNNDKGCQTVDSVDIMQSLQNELKELRRKLVASEKSSERLTALQASTRKLESSSFSGKKIVVNTDVGNNEEALQKLQAEVQELQGRCEQKDKEIEKLRRQGGEERVMRVNVASATSKLLHAARAIKSGFLADKAVIEEELEEYRALLLQNTTKLAQADKDREKSADEAEALKLALNLRETQLNSAELESEVARSEALKWKSQFQNLEKSVLAKQEAAVVTAKEVANVLAAAAERSEMIVQENESSSKDNAIAELKEKNRALSNDREKYFEKFSTIQGKLKRVRRQLKSLSDAHEDEVKAVKHAAHVKDLGRISAAREITLERDKALNDLDYAKEVENVLSFAVNTLEQTLLEDQPLVVMKVAERRAKRLKQLAKSAKKANRDVDQRSTDVLAVSGAALEGFKAKADSKLIAAIDTRTKMAALLAEQLGEETSEDKEF
jgi:chromosome segregation ATPase